MGKYKLGLCYQMPRRKKTSAKTVMSQKQIVNINTRREKSMRPPQQSQPQRMPLVMSQYPTFYPIYSQSNPLTQSLTAVRNMPTAMPRVEQDIPQQFTALPPRQSPNLPDIVATPVKVEHASNNPDVAYGFQDPSFNYSRMISIQAETPMAKMADFLTNMNPYSNDEGVVHGGGGGGGSYSDTLTGFNNYLDRSIQHMSMGRDDYKSPNSPYESAESKDVSFG